MDDADPYAHGGSSDDEEFDAGAEFEWQQEEPIMEDLPPELHCFETGEPFKVSLIHQTPLTGDVPYSVRKVYRGSEVIMECAMTLDEMSELEEGLSESSKARIEEHVGEQLDLADRFEKLMENPDGPEFGRWTSRCAFTGQPREECKEYSITALCQGGKLLYLPNSPVMLSDTFAEIMQSLLSEETRRYLDDFVGEHFPTPPNLEDLPVRPMLIG